MTFNDPIFFIFFVILLLCIPHGTQLYKKIILLLASYTFYGFWDWRFLGLLCVSTVVDFWAGARIYKSKVSAEKKLLLILSILVNIGILGFFKYCNFFIESITNSMTFLGREVSISTLNIILPVGISFYTFQTMSYTIDIYKGKMKPTSSLLDFSLFVAFFPQLVAGPIERATRLLPKIRNFNGIYLPGIIPGITLMFSGFVRKVFIADSIAPIVDSTFNNYSDFGSADIITGLILFAFQIYFDFSGYSEIAIGTAKIFGIDLMVNFRQPYLSTNISEFWHRWHISLSTWLRDYVYIPLGGNRKGESRTNINLMVTMLLGGLWHGASWNFVIWGAIHGIYLVSHKAMSKYFNFTLPSFMKPVSIFLIFILVLITWLPFRVTNFTDSVNCLKIMINWRGPLLPSHSFVLLFVIIAFFILDIPGYITGSQYYLLRLPRWIITPVAASGLIITFFYLLFIGGYAQPFIYFQF